MVFVALIRCRLAAELLSEVKLLAPTGGSSIVLNRIILIGFSILQLFSPMLMGVRTTRSPNVDLAHTLATLLPSMGLLLESL